MSPAASDSSPRPLDLAQPAEYRFYRDLATWWPLISPPDEYTEEGAYLAEVLDSASIAVGDVLELGSGGGHVAFHLKQRFTMTLVDLSEQMLAISRDLNPECEHMQGDMRHVRLGRQFDAVLIHDAIDYMATEADLLAAMGTARTHCRPGGMAVFVPDATAELYEEEADHGGRDAADGRGVRYLDWTWDPDPNDSWVQTEYAFLLRHRDGSVEVVHESHRIGRFGRDHWLRLIGEAGFEAEVVTEITTEDRTPRLVFLGHVAV